MAEKKEKLEKVKLKLRKKHPKKAFRLGKHVVTHIFQEFELSEAEMVELQSKGCKAWLISDKEEAEIKKAKADARKKAEADAKKSK
jgi:hypothetical protein